MTNRLDSDQVSPGEGRLARALEEQTEGLELAADSLGTIRARIGRDSGHPGATTRPRYQRRGLVAGLVALGVAALGVAAAATVVVLGTGTDRLDTAAEPARTASVAVPGDVDPSTPRTSWTVYRVGADPERAGRLMLFAEEVRATAPYEPRQALEQLLALPPPVDPTLGNDGSSPATQVGAVARTGSEITVDLTAVDPGRWVTGTDAAPTAQAWVQAWVATVQEAYQSDDPVVFTLNGQPLPTLFGVDTSKPVRRDELKTGFSHQIFLPRDGEEVSSPVALAANPPTGEFTWTLVSRTTGDTVFRTSTSADAEYGASTYTVDDLDPDRYRFTVRQDVADELTGTTGWVRTVDFRVRS